MNTLTFEIPHGLARRLRPVGEALARFRAARSVREVRARPAGPGRSNEIARDAALAILRAHGFGLDAGWLATRPCGRCHWHRACTCPLFAS